uniref:DUF4371 domain-containing protein n=1 Tax=Cyprinodon variegatus TaxID=28743 RepID=A0A3Q2CIT8_CYPVA
LSHLFIEKRKKNFPDLSENHLSRSSSGPSRLDTPEESGGAKRPKMRHYNDRYLKYGFFWSGDATCPTPVCLISRETLANNAMDYKNKDIEFFKRLKSQNLKSSLKQKSRTPFSLTTPSNGALTICPLTLKLVSDRLRQSGKFSLQIDDSTDESAVCHLIANVRNVDEDRITENFLFCKALRNHATGDEMFRVTNDYFMENGLNWQMCAGICTDGAACMTGRAKGFVTKAKERNPIIGVTLHAPQGESYCKNPDLTEVWGQAVKIVNYIKSHPVKTLPLGKALAHVYELREELLAFAREHHIPFQEQINDFWLKLASLANIYEHMNELNVKMKPFSQQQKKAMATEAMPHTTLPFFSICVYPFHNLTTTSAAECLTTKGQDELVELQAERTLKLKHSEPSLDTFSAISVDTVTLPPTFELALSSLTYMKNKLRERLPVEEDLCVSLPPTPPHINRLQSETGAYLLCSGYFGITYFMFLD